MLICQILQEKMDFTGILTLDDKTGSGSATLLEMHKKKFYPIYLSFPTKIFSNKHKMEIFKQI